MKEATLTLIMCLLIGTALCNVFPRPCEKVKDGLCGKGQYLVYNDLDHPACLDCPPDTFMDYESHLCERCKFHSQPNPGETIAQQGDSTSDNSLVCGSGFYRRRATSVKIGGQCQQCSVCGDGSWAALECGLESDVFCCVRGMVAVEVEGVLTCAVPASKQGRQIAEGRKGRSPLAQAQTGGNDVPSSEPAYKDGTAKGNRTDTAPGDKTSDKPHVLPNHSYSQAEEEPRRQMVEFPVWARFLCAGIAVGIFLFYLGVGIPCNACGSLDKLKLLKARMTRSNNRRPSQEESKKPMNPKAEAEQV